MCRQQNEGITGSKSEGIRVRWVDLNEYQEDERQEEMEGNVSPCN